MVGVSLFTGAGGLDLGLEAAGIEIALAVESDSTTVRSIRRNTAWEVLNEDISNISAERVLDTLGYQRADLEILTGGPPCQPFSKLAYWAGEKGRDLDDPRAQTLHEYFRLVEGLLPKVFLLENVPAFGQEGASTALSYLRSLVGSIYTNTSVRYSLSAAILNAVEYGAPQLRQRIFIVGVRNGKAFQFPSRTHTHPSIEGQGQLSLEQLAPYHTAWDAIGDLDSPEQPGELEVAGRWADLLPSIPEGENYLYHTSRGNGKAIFGWRRRYWNFLLKLAKDRPSWTITATPVAGIGPFHWGNRRLSRRELCRLQTFPDDYEPVGDLDEVQRQLGNAVPVVLAKALGRAIRERVFGHELEDKHVSSRLSRNRPIPQPEEVADVPESYRGLIGGQEPHPGEGKGPGAWEDSEEARVEPRKKQIDMWELD